MLEEFPVVGELCLSFGSCRPVRSKAGVVREHDGRRTVHSIRPQCSQDNVGKARDLSARLWLATTFDVGEQDDEFKKKSTCPRVQIQFHGGFYGS